MVAESRELVVLAQRGDAAALGELLALHRAGMMAVALSVLPRAAEAEDAVQDASLTALTRIADLRDPAAAGPWLRMIVRNVCRMRLRAASPAHLFPGEPPAHLLPAGSSATVRRSGTPAHGLHAGTPADGLPAGSPAHGRPAESSATARPAGSPARVSPPPASGPGNPEELLERQALRDWVAHAVGRLSAPLRTVTLLRYFSTVHTYDDIAAICGVPSGTVRRRLHEARKQLAGALTAARSAAYDGAAAVGEHRAAAEAAARAGREGTFGAYLRDAWHPDVEAAWSDGRRATGLPPLVTVMDRNVSAGMLPRVADVSATRDLVLWEIDVLAVAQAERTCAAQAYWLMSVDRGRVSGLRVFQR
ncbi:sigma-70 family RNA polymerase sigma factor [Catenuloplanes sp. NPDC051500]|uniref:sigma-70 family RNA polymerase sigma factor n=1 Tax=Catenuloplanes sp. NPDC051500 TaxID=3363959 RepID=UPI0037978FAE